METVLRFALALDEEDYATLATLIADDCEYVTRKGTIRGRQEVIRSYQTASALAKATVNSVTYESYVRSEPNGPMTVTFVDHLEHDGLRHSFSCEQVVYLGAEDRVFRIVHQELPGQREALDVFLATTKNTPRS